MNKIIRFLDRNTWISPFGCYVIVFSNIDNKPQLPLKINAVFFHRHNPSVLEGRTFELNRLRVKNYIRAHFQRPWQKPSAPLQHTCSRRVGAARLWRQRRRPSRICGVRPLRSFCSRHFYGVTFLSSHLFGRKQDVLCPEFCLKGSTIEGYQCATIRKTWEIWNFQFKGYRSSK